LVQQAVRFGEHVEASRSEWFLPGTQQSVVALDAPRGAVQPAAAPRITSPVDGTIVALDPDIPAERQRVAMRAVGAGPWRWRVDGREFARGAQAGWLPWPGRHLLQLVDASGRIADEVRIEVRGAGVTAARPRQ
jgi:penicillin-binding protein 1C